MKKLFIVLLILAFPALTFCADITTYVFGPGLTLPKTGQTTEYQAGDDGTYQKGSKSTPEFVDNGDGTISDRVTGLMWIKQPSLIIPGASVTATNQAQVAHGDWATAHAYVIGDLVRDAAGTNATACNISGATAANPCVLTVDSVQGIVSGQSVLINSITGDMGVDVLNGNIFYAKVSGLTLTLYSNAQCTTGVNTGGKTYTSGGTAKQTKFFITAINHTSDTIANDLAAGKLRETVWVASAADLTHPTTMTWSDSIINSEALVYAGYSDWRMPNVKEFFSLTKHSGSAPYINGTFFPNTQSYSYWSSSTYAVNTVYAWSVDFSNGRVNYYVKSNPNYVRPVRSSQ